MKRISQSNLSLTLMILFVTTNIPFIFANDTISDKKLSTKILDGLSKLFIKIGNDLCAYVKNVHCMSLYVITSSVFLFPLLILLYFRSSDEKNGIIIFCLLFNIALGAIFSLIMPALILFFPSYTKSLTIVPICLIYIGTVILTIINPPSPPRTPVY